MKTLIIYTASHPYLSNSTVISKTMCWCLEHRFIIIDVRCQLSTDYENPTMAIDFETGETASWELMEFVINNLSGCNMVLNDND
jgi:hypothetical protein